jgi:hypothetical protein
LAKHLLIAGTGRAGTSFLVRYLTELGLDTHLSRAGASAGWHEHANAGLEDLPLSDTDDLPYVIKSPWAYQYIEDLLANPTMELDAVVVPMRDLVEAAASRCIIELRDRYDKMPWMGKFSQTWEHFAQTPGGVIFSTNPVDEARLLAVGFHHLLDQLVKADIPIVMLSFPRLIEDRDYLYRKLVPVLPRDISVDVGYAAHTKTADPLKVRVGEELNTGPYQGFTLTGPGHQQLDRIALLRVLADHQGQLADAVAAERIALDEIDRHARDLRVTQEALAAMTEARDVAVSNAVEQQATADAMIASANSTIGTLREERDRYVASAEAMERMIAATAEERDRARGDLASLVDLRHQLDCIQESTTWQAAQMLQRVAKRLPWAITLAHWLIRAGLAREQRT